MSDAIQEIVDRETRAWATQDVDLLLSIFHPDMVWPWPPDGGSHDPATWVWGQGRFDEARWRADYTALFAAHELVHNRRSTVRISVAPDGGGAFAVVDVDTLWRPRDGSPDMHWRGRACKIYTRMPDGWKLVAHTGLLDHG